MSKVSSILTIFILVLVIIIILLVFYAVRKAQEKLRQCSQVLFGTNSMTKGIEKMQAEYASTPKSVSGMTSLCLPRITKDFPDFNYDEMRDRANNVLCSYLLSIDSKNPAMLTDGNSELRQKLELQINMLNDKHVTEHYERLKVHRTEISQYRKDKGRCTITFQSSIQYYHYVTDAQHAVLEGRNDSYVQSKYDIDLIYIQDRTLVEQDSDMALGINCPNCGAPVSGLGAKHCEYCGSPIIELNIHAWSFSDIREIK